MRTRNVGRLICTLAVASMTALTVVSCGSSNFVSTYTSHDGGGDVSVGGGYDGTFASDSPTGHVCIPKTCADLGYTCGMNGDGCGGQINCNTGEGGAPCPYPQICGGGGKYSQCGGDITKLGDGGICTPKTCQDWGYTCGAAGDGCGNPLDCNVATDSGSPCPAGEFCGGGGFNKCGNPTSSDGGPPPTCMPKTCQSLGYECGPAGDGCNNALNCGTCPTGQVCGLGGPFKCGSPTPTSPDGGPIICTPTTCQALGYTCGAAGDGCGGLLNCGTCTAPAFCGGGGFDVCGTMPSVPLDSGPSCTPTTCAAQGFNCGFASDQCNGLLNCGTCSGGNICGGGGQPNVCGSTIPCTGLCQQQVPCDGGGQTTITGRVVAGTLPVYGPPDPVPNVLVYVPNAPLQAFTGLSCSQCGADVSGSPLVTTNTAFDGTFTLTNVPTGSQIPLVIQLGRWRRVVNVNIPSCATTAVGDIHMPRTQNDSDVAGTGNIPFTGLSTGNVDAMECVLLKMGIDSSEFTQPGAGGRIEMYKGNGANAGMGTPREPALMDTGGSFLNYDQIILPCWGVNPVPQNSSNRKSATELANLVTYANSGGHFFATHFSYAWLYNNNPFNTTAQWDVNANTNTNNNLFTGNVSLNVPPAHPGVFEKWLNLVGALSNTNPPQVSLFAARHDADQVKGGSADWIDGTDPNPNANPREMLLHYTFDTPVGGSNQCGHAIFSDFHVTNQNATNGFNFTDQGDRDTECGTSPMTAQERILEFMIWDLASCVPAPPTPTCTPQTCSSQNLHCGPAGDGCGNQINCGMCPPGNSCIKGMCTPPDGGLCAPQSCSQQKLGCGPAGDGCGNAINCGTCQAPQTCGGCGVPGQCCAPDAGTCVPLTCAQQNITCGPAGDGCGNALDCGPCTQPDAGVGCTPESCGQQGIGCGPAGDGCGNQIDCGPCPTGQTCGGGGIFGQCVPMGGPCTPQTCAQLNIFCGPAGDGCGGLLNCGTCATGSCGAVTPGVCGGGTF